MTRYFLRRLAMSLRGRYRGKVRAAVWNAKIETIALFVTFPAFGLLGFIILGSLRFMTREQVMQIHLPPKLLFVTVVCGLSVLLGNLALGRNFQKYVDDPAPCYQFDTARDRYIAMWQKFGGFVIACIVLPILGLLVAYA